VIEKLYEAVIGYGPSLVGALIILLLGWTVTRVLAGLLVRGLRRASVDPILERFIRSVFSMGTMTLVAIAALGQLGVNTTSFAAVIAAAGLAIGLAFQGSLSNLASGVLLILFRPFKVGDYVEAAGVSGSVEEVQIFATILRTPDNKRVVVGNSSVLGDTITNYSAEATRRVDMVFGIGYDDDLRKAKQILEEILSADPRVLSEPAPTVALLALADSSVNLAVRPWVATGDYWGVFFDLNEKVKNAFDGAGISIPYPQNDVHLKGAA
jgi:small conductance mechanosensitive channel